MLTYKDFKIEPVFVDHLGITTFLAPTATQNQQFPPSGTYFFSIGQRLRATISIKKDVAFADGECYIFTHALWNNAPRLYAPNLGIGWKINVSKPPATPASASWSLVAQGAEAVQQNIGIYSVSFDAPEYIMTIEFDFYATMDTAEWLSADFINNEFRWQKDLETSNLVTLTGQSVYTVPKFFETSFYKADPLTLQPSSIADFAKDPNNNNAMTYNVKMQGRFFDRGLGGVQSWSGGVLSEPALSRLLIKNPSGTSTTDYQRIAAPSLSTTNDLNFTNIIDPANIGYVENAGANSFQLDVSFPAFPAAVDTVELRIIDVTKNKFSNIVDFYMDYKADSILLTQVIPYTDSTLPPNWFSSDYNTFGSPVNVQYLPTLFDKLGIQFTLDGSKLQTGHFYRIIAVLSDAATGDSTSHITPQFVVKDVPNTLSTVKGVIDVYNNSFLGDNVNVSSLERYRCIIDIDGNSWTAGLADFTANLRSVGFKKYSPTNQVIEQGRYDYRAGVSVGQVPIVFTNSSPSFVFQADFRAELNASILQTYKVIWEIEVDDVGTLQTTTNIYTYEQRINVRPFGATRIKGLRLLDYNAFQASIIQPIQTICRSDDFVVVEVEKNGNPDAYLQALLVFLDNNGNLVSVQEEESYLGSQLPIGTSNFISQVDSTFGAGDNFAYYVLQVSNIPQGQNNVWFGALIENI